ncbi:MAG: hypothetical protein FWG96_05690 [Methanomassiliicoccaceae archaeon]|nr:hypothetical protein [Methanomassiliicoccaceae archaeon]
MEIPALYSVFKNGEVRSAPVRFDGTRISFETEPAPPAYSADETEDRMPILVVDMRGLGRKEMDDRLITDMKFPGSDVWLMTHIKDVEDVFDSFMGDIVKLLIPYHTTRNDLVMSEAYEVSEHCMPVLFVSQGRVLCRGEQTTDIREAMEGLAGRGFLETAVLDTDSLLRAEDWAYLYDRFPELIPFVRKKDGPAGDIGFQKIIVDL